jgi:hypothetical protein
MRGTISAAVITFVFVVAILAGLPVQAQDTTCSSFTDQASAQAKFRASPSILRHLDEDGDGIACESNPCPCDMVPVIVPAQPTSTPTPAATATPSPTPSPSASPSVTVTPSPTPTPPLGATEQLLLFRGCNNVTSTYPNGTPAAQLFGGVNAPGARLSGWIFINSQQRFAGYSPLPGAPNDLTVVNRGDPLLICVTGPATFTRPAS